MSGEVAEHATAEDDADYEDTGGVGGTLAGNALSAAAIRATLDQVLTEKAFERMIELAGRFTEGVQAVLDGNGLPWHVVQLGAAPNTGSCPTLPPMEARRRPAPITSSRSTSTSSASTGMLITPFHNMALMSPATEAGDVDRHTEVFTEACELLAR